MKYALSDRLRTVMATETYRTVDVLHLDSLPLEHDSNAEKQINSNFSFKSHNLNM